MVRRASREEADAIDVELVETWSDDEDLVPPEPPAPGQGPLADGTATTAPRWSWRKRVIAGVVTGVAVAAFFGVGAFQGSRQEAARQEALARSPGVLAPIDGPLEEVWRMAAGALVAEAAGLMIVRSGQPPEDTGVIRGVEPFTGDVAWEYTPLNDGSGYTSCRGLLPDGTGPESAQEGPATDQRAASLLACVNLVDRGTRGLGNWDPSSNLYVLDARTGDEILTVPLDGSTMMWDVVEGDVALMLVLPDGHVTATRVSVPDGERVWTYRSDAPVMSGDGSVVWGAWPEEGRFVIQGDPGIALDLVTGEQVPGPRVDGLPVAPMSPIRTTLPDGGTAEWTPSRTGSGAGRVLDADGTERFALDGPVVSMPADGSVPDRIVVEQERVNLFTVVDSTDGHVVWRGETAQRPVARLDGLLVVVGVDVLRGIRLRDGVEQWSLTAMNAHQVPVLTDGRVLLVRRDAGSQGIVAAVDATDGTELWQMPLPDDVLFLGGTDAGVVLGHAPDGIAVYR